MPNVGDVWVNVLPNMVGFEAALATQVSGAATAAGAAASAATSAAVVGGAEKTAAASAGRVTTAFGTLGTLAGTAFAAYFGMKSIHIYESLEIQTKRLEYGMEKLYGTAGSAIAGNLVDFAKEFSLATGKSEVDIVKLEASLTNLGHTVLADLGPDAAQKVVQDLTGALIDMAGATGKPLQMFMRSVGPSILNDPARAIPMLVKFNALTQEQAAHIGDLMKAGKQHEATLAIITATTERFEGASKAAATPLELLKALFQQVEYTVGRAFTPVLEAAVFLLRNIPKPIQMLVIGLGALTTAVILAQRAWKLLASTEVLVKVLGLFKALIPVTLANAYAQGVSAAATTANAVAQGAVTVATEAQMAAATASIGVFARLGIAATALKATLIPLATTLGVIALAIGVGVGIAFAIASQSNFAKTVVDKLKPIVDWIKAHTSTRDFLAETQAATDYARTIINNMSVFYDKTFDLSQKWEKLRNSVTDAWREWRKSTSDAVNTVGSDIEGLLGNIVSPGSLLQEADRGLSNITRWGADMDRLLANATPQAKMLAQMFLNVGPTPTAIMDLENLLSHPKILGKLEETVFAAHTESLRIAGQISDDMNGTLQEQLAAVYQMKNPMLTWEQSMAAVAEDAQATMDATKETYRTLVSIGELTSQHAAEHDAYLKSLVGIHGTADASGYEDLSGKSWVETHGLNQQLLPERARSGIRSFSPGTGGAVTRAEISITDWEHGKGYIRWLARDEMSQADTYHDSAGRMNK